MSLPTKFQGNHMTIRLQEKSDLYIFAGYVFIGIALAFNQFTLPWWQEIGLFPTIPHHFMHSTDVEVLLPWLLDIFLVTTGLIMVRVQRPIRVFINDSFRFNLFIFLTLTGILLSTNVILPGKFRLLRVLLILSILFFLTNMLYLSVVKKREGKPELQSFYRNLGVSLYGLLFVLLLLEIIFMFFVHTHRFNGTLASRSWFIRHWELNSEGYRDGDYDAKKIEGKTKVMVLGDSFVAGHGVEDLNDRFSHVLQTHLGDAYYVFNLGVGGSDVADAVHRLREFPYQPDLLVFSYYPNDIERDGETGGLVLQRARSYNDLWRISRFFVRRSYLLNYAYWQFPHPDELSDYLGYLHQCYASPNVMGIHTGHLDQLVDYADSLAIPFASVVFPFLENVAGSNFATEPIVEHLQNQNIPVLDVRSMVATMPTEALVVNNNDPHPSEKLNQMVGDSLYVMLKENGYFPQ